MNHTNQRTNRDASTRRGRFTNTTTRPNRSRYNSSRTGGFSGSGRRFSNKGGSRGNGKNKLSFDPTLFINQNPSQIVEEKYVAENKFSDFNFDKKLSDGLNKAGFTTPSPIQDKVIPHILAKRDVIGLAETGTGKTAAFLLPLIQHTLNDRQRLTLILTPTRELAIQISEELRKFTYGQNIYSTVCVGGVNIRPQINSLKRKNHFIIGTPGRVLDLMDRGHLKTAKIRTVVLDEADRMLDMGFINDMRKILENTRSDRETLFFSATMSPAIEKLVHDFLRDPITISVKKKDVTNSIRQDVVRYQSTHKFNTLLALLKTPACQRVLVFGAMKHSVEKLSRELCQVGIMAESIHGNKSHEQRQRSLKKFKNGLANVLVATDVAARGIHIDNVTHVINYDLPNTFEDYVHRIGRTGRATNTGIALSFVPQ